MIKKKILILGIHGFLGSALSRYIRDQYPACQIFGISRSGKGNSKNQYLCDINDSKKLEYFILRIKPDIIFHLAGGRSDAFRELLTDNFLSTQSLFGVLEQLPRFHPRVIIPGTAAEYGLPHPKVPRMTEKFPTQPISWYGFVKSMQANLSLIYAKRGLDIIIARMFNVMGSGIPSHLALGEFARQIALIEKGRQNPVIKTKNLEGRRDFLDVNDVCSALMLIALKGKAGEIYNVCSGKACSIKELLRTMIMASTCRRISVREDKHVSSGSYNVIGSNHKLRSSLKWNPSISIKQSLQETLNFYRSKLH